MKPDSQDKKKKLRSNHSGRTVSMLGMFTAAAMICSYIESLIPINFGIPGIKLGLANLVVLLVLYTMGTKEAVTVSILRIILTGFLFGNMFAILYSLAGGLLSFLVMWLLKRIGLHMVFVSVAGGISHNIGQLFVAALVVDNYNILFYIPVLLIAGILTGLLIGILSQEVVLRLKGIIGR